MLTASLCEMEVIKGMTASLCKNQPTDLHTDYATYFHRFFVAERWIGCI